jgi:hypothetical protein
MEQVDKQLEVYLPETDQLVVVDANKEMLTQFGWDLQNATLTNCLGLFRLAFVETNAQNLAVSVALRPEAMQLPAAAGDVYITFKVEPSGRIQSIEQTSLGVRHISVPTYISFVQTEVGAGAPAMPVGKKLLTDKPFPLALQEEIIEVKKKQSQLKI